MFLAIALTVAVASPTTASLLSAQELTLYLVDEQSGTPISGAVVALLDSAETAIWTSVSNEDGQLVLSPPSAGEYYIEANGLGYETYRSPLLALGLAGDLSLELPMRAAPVGLAGFEVVGEVQGSAQLESMGLSVAELGSRWIDRSEIEATQMTGGTKEIIRGQNIPGLWIDEAAAVRRPPRLCVSMRGRTGCAITVLDGAVIDPQVASYLDPQTLEAMAILRPREAAILYGTTGGNGAVLFWTRGGRAR